MVNVCIYIINRIFVAWLPSFVAVPVAAHWPFVELYRRVADFPGILKRIDPV